LVFFVSGALDSAEAGSSDVSGDILDVEKLEGVGDNEIYATGYKTVVSQMSI